MSFRFRLIVTISLLIALAVGIGGTVLISISFQSSLEAEKARALQDFEGVQYTLYLFNSLGEQNDYQALCRTLQQMQGSWQAISLSTQTETLFVSHEQALAQSQLLLTEAQSFGYQQLQDSYGRGLVAACRMEAGKDVLTLTARFDLSGVYQRRESQLSLYLWVYIAVVMAGILTAVVLSFTLTVRLHRLTATVRRISGGDLSRRSRLTSQDEFGQLSRDFDAMADKLQENIESMEDQMQRQEAFMGAFAHELKTPMTSIIGYADLLRQGGLDETTRIMAADYIFTEGQRLEKLSFKLLDLLLLEKDALQRRSIPLAPYMQEVERALAPVLQKKGIRLVCRGDKQRVLLEPDLVKSLLYNLIDNASKAMDAGGVIAVKASAFPGGCQLLVADSGRGMEEKELSRITEAFYRVDKSRSRQQGGAGLGLALCKRIAQLHWGDIAFDSVLGKGTRVTVTLYEEAPE